MKDLNLNIMYDFGEIKEDEINFFEKKYNITFPLSYKQLISSYNGVQFVENTFEYIDSAGIVAESGLAFCSFGEDAVGGDNIEDYQDYDVYGYKGVITFGLNGGGDYIVFDYREDFESNNPSIAIMYHDEYISDENGEFKMKIIKVADSFEDFLNLLHE